MGPTRTRELLAATLAAAVFGYLVVRGVYRYFPAVTLCTGLSLLAVAAGEAAWAWSVRSRIREGRIGVGGGRLHPLAVARTVAIAKASAWVGAVMLGWWLGVLAYLLPRRSELRVAAADAPALSLRQSAPSRSSWPRCGCSIAASRLATRSVARMPPENC